MFENLHWQRYGEDDRAAFLAGLQALAEARPALRVLVRPHPAGGWGDRLLAGLERFGQVSVQRAEQARASLDGPAELMGMVGKVITTPSTIALDAALAGRPVALAAYGGEPYRPLPVVRTPQDWIAFADDSRMDRSALDLFRSRVLVAGDAAPRIAGRIVRDLSATCATDD